MRSTSRLTAAQFKLILHGFPKMERMDLYQQRLGLTRDDLQYLERFKNLKFISLANLDDTVRYEVKKGELFNVINVDQYGTLKMAVDQRTMNIEL